NDLFPVTENGSSPATQVTVALPGVLANDIDVDSPSQTLTAVLDAGPTHATQFSLSSNGSFTYTPTVGFFGTDTFSYHAFDGTTSGNTAIVTIVVGLSITGTSFT